MLQNLKLLEDLSERFNRDQKLLKEGKLKEYIQLTQENSDWLKNVINNYGWPSSKLVGTTGEQYAWLIAQHSEDIDFQEKCLQLLKGLTPTDERKGHIAYLTDRILVKKGEKQLYGTQFKDNQPFPIKNERELDFRRQQMGLIKLTRTMNTTQVE